MESINASIQCLKSNPVRAGVLTVLATIATGMVIAFATGITTPAEIKASIIPQPPCCVLPPLPPLPTPPIPPIIPQPPCCETTPIPEPPPSPPPPVIPQPPCCEVTPTPELPPPPPPVIPQPPCCEVIPPPPTTPPVFPPPIPPIIPPITPPVEDEGRCISLTASRSVITAPGQAVVLTWVTDDVDSVSINNGVGRVTPTSSGSVTVYPTGDTTYVATVEGGDQSDNCRASVRLEVIVTEEPRCIDLSANKTRIEEGESIILSWVTHNASSVRINNGIGEVTPVRSGSITVRPSSSTTYIATVPGAPDNPDCRVSVEVERERDRDRDHDRDRPDRDRERPEVFIDSITRPAEPPLAAVYLSEIPYTGLDLGPVGTVVYWLMLILWSAAAAYLVLFNFLPYLFRRAAQDALHESGYLPGFGPGAVAASPKAPAPAVHQAAHRAAVATAMPAKSVVSVPEARVHSPHEGFRSFATGGALTIDDIVKGLSRESEMELTRGPIESPAPVARVEAPAPKNAPAYSDNIPGFIEALINGDRDHVFGTVRNIAKQGGNTEEFISEAVCALDDAYRAHTEGTQVHPEVARVTRDCHPSFLEKLVSSLATAVDSTYSAGVTGTKLALTRALNVVNG